MYITRYSCQILKKLVFSLQIFEKSSDVYENPSSVTQVVSCGRTDKRTDIYDETNSPFLRIAKRQK
jgi:hypothetical protein